MAKRCAGGTLAFDGTVIKQERRGHHNEGHEETASEVKVTLPTLPGTSSQSNGNASRVAPDDGGGDMIIKQEKIETEDGSITVRKGLAGGHIICAGDSGGDEWVVHQVPMDDGEGGEEDINLSQPSMSDPGQELCCHEPILGHLSIVSSLGNPVLNTTVSVKQENNLTKGSVLGSSTSLYRGNQNSLIKNLLGITSLPNENSSSVPVNHILHVNQSRNGLTEEVISGLHSVSQTTAGVGDVGKNLEEFKERKCEQCGDIFTTPGSFKSHMLYHKSMETLNGTLVECAVCENLMPRHYIKYHLKIHSGEKPFECNVCHKAFVHQRSLNFHSKLHTRKKQTYNCTICNKDFAHEYLLRRHSVIHEKYKCPICGHHSTDKHKFESHKHKHETKVYKCDICGKNYSKEASLISHKCLVHMVTGKIFVERLVMYKCDDCGHAFADGPGLRDHIPLCAIRERRLEEKKFIGMA